MLFRECMGWGLRITDDELRFWALERNRGMRCPLDKGEAERQVEQLGVFVLGPIRAPG